MQQMCCVRVLEPRNAPGAPVAMLAGVRQERFWRAFAGDGYPSDHTRPCPGDRFERSAERWHADRCGTWARVIRRAHTALFGATSGAPLSMLRDMTIQRMDNVAIVVEDLDAAIAFFAELGMEREGNAQIEGPVADRTVGLDGVRSDIAMMRTPDGHSKLELRNTTPPRRSAPDRQTRRPTR